MTNERKVDVVAVLESEIAAYGLHTPQRFDLIEALDAVKELVAAVIENREATQAFANDGMPENYARFDDSERRLLSALSRIGGES